MTTKYVHKHQLPFPWEKSAFTLDLPSGTILDVQRQEQYPVLWHLHRGGDTRPVGFRWVATGEPVTEAMGGWVHVATVQFVRYGYVAHLFLTADGGLLP